MQIALRVCTCDCDCDHFASSILAVKCRRYDTVMYLESYVHRKTQNCFVNLHIGPGHCACLRSWWPQLEPWSARSALSEMLAMLPTPPCGLGLFVFFLSHFSFNRYLPFLAPLRRREEFLPKCCCCACGASGVMIVSKLSVCRHCLCLGCPWFAAAFASHTADARPRLSTFSWTCFQQSSCVKVAF